MTKRKREIDYTRTRTSWGIKRRHGEKLCVLGPLGEIAMEEDWKGRQEQIKQKRRRKGLEERSI